MPKIKTSPIYRLLKFERKYILLIYMLFLFLIPSLFWFQGNYQVGGDETMLYYIFPYQMIKGSIQTLPGQVFTILGLHQLPFFSFIFFLKTIIPFGNIQLLLYGLNLAVGFISFYFLMDIVLKEKSEKTFFPKLVSAFAYIESVYFFNTLLTGTYLTYLVSVFPLILYIFFKSVQEKKIFLVYVAALVLSVFCNLLLGTPWLLLAIIASIPISIVVFEKELKRFLYNGFLFVVITFLFNFYWLIQIIYPILDKGEKGDVVSSLSSTSFIEGAIFILKEVTFNNSLIYPFTNLFFKNLSSPGYFQNINYYNFFLPFNLIFVYIFLSVFLFFHKLSTYQKKLYIAAFVTWLFCIYVFTIKLYGNFGLNQFIAIIHHFPLLGMFRNNYGKIAPALPFSFAVLLGISLNVLFAQIKKAKLNTSIAVICISLLSLTALPFFLGNYFKSPLPSTYAYPFVSKINHDFLSMTEYIGTLPDNGSNFTWFPVPSVNYVFLRDEYNKNLYYAGTSPLFFLTGKTDYVGLLEFPEGTSPKFFDNLSKKHYEDIGKFYQQLNITYIIDNKDLSDNFKNSYFFTARTKGDLIDLQTTAYRKEVLGKKIASFNNKYDIYLINNKYSSEKIYLSDSNGTKIQNNNIQFVKNTNSEYKIHLSHIKGTIYVVFLQQYSPYWKLLSADKQLSIPYMSKKSIFQYAMIWKLNTNDIIKHTNPSAYHKNSDGTLDINILLYFTLQSYTKYGELVSITSFVIITTIFLILWLKSNKIWIRK